LVAFGFRCTYATFAVCALCCSVFQRVAACSSGSSVLQCVAVCCSVWAGWQRLELGAHIQISQCARCVAVCYSVLQCVSGLLALRVRCAILMFTKFRLECRYKFSPSACACSHVLASSRCVLQCVAVCCNVLQCAAVCCSVLQCVAVCCSVLQCVCSMRRMHLATFWHRRVQVLEISTSACV